MIKWTLKNKLTISILGTIFVFGSTAVYFVYLYSKGIFFEKEEQLLKTIVMEESHNISNIFQNSKLIADKITSQDILVTYLEDNNRKQQDLNILNLFNSYNINNSYSSIYVLDRNGVTQTSIDESFTGNNYSFRDYFKEALNGNPYIDASIGVTSKELGYYFSYPVKDINKNILGVLVLKLDPKVVENFINLSNVDWNYSNILLVDEYGVVIFSNNKDFIYKSIVKLSESELEEIDLKQRFLGVDIASINNYGLNKSDLYLENNYERLIDIKNKNKIFLFSEVESTPFFIVIDKNRDIIFEDIKKTSRILALFVFFAALFAALVIKFIVSKFLSPLITLNKIMEEASIEDLTSKIRLDCDDEVCGLVKNFNKMIEKLKNELELSKKSVSERTTQLEEINRVMTGRELKMIELKKELFDLKNK